MHIFQKEKDCIALKKKKSNTQQKLRIAVLELPANEGREEDWYSASKQVTLPWAKIGVPTDTSTTQISAYNLVLGLASLFVGIPSLSWGIHSLQYNTR